MASISHLHREMEVLTVADHLSLLCSLHPHHHDYLTVLQPFRLLCMKHTLQSRFLPSIAHLPSPNRDCFPSTYTPSLNSLHSSAVQQAISAAGSNRVLQLSPPPISEEERSLPISTRTLLFQLRSDHSRVLNSYQARIGAVQDPTCPACGAMDQTTSHLLSCPHTPTHLTPLDRAVSGAVYRCSIRCSIRCSVQVQYQQIHDVEHLWRCSESEVAALRQPELSARQAMESNSADFLNNLCQIADNRLYKIVKWCKSLPLFRHITIDDQICLLINSWCELLLLSCCFRSMESPGEIRVSSGRCMTLEQAEHMGIGPCIDRMLNLTYQLRRLQVDKYEYMAMKVIVLLSSDVGGLKEKERVQYSQERVLHALEEYTRTNYPNQPAKYGEILMRIPELQRTCHTSKELLSMKKKEGDSAAGRSQRRRAAAAAELVPKAAQHRQLLQQLEQPPLHSTLQLQCAHCAAATAELQQLNSPVCGGS
ncbi:Nuclear hormone receptor ligand-binding domain [Trinorchestia longiramus]|nr:Nuclear hormone receptor ligand-binding domain [Trinorchestia longiramus]